MRLTGSRLRVQGFSGISTMSSSRLCGTARSAEIYKIKTIQRKSNTALMIQLLADSMISMSSHINSISQWCLNLQPEPLVGLMHDIIKLTPIIGKIV